MTREQLLLLCALGVGTGFAVVWLSQTAGSEAAVAATAQSRWHAEQVAALRQDVATLRSELEAVRAEAKAGDAETHARLSAAEVAWSTTQLAACAPPSPPPLSASKVQTARAKICAG